MLYPRESESRQIKDLSGIWKFKVDKNAEGYKKKWFTKTLTDTILMPVPASYNDITQDITIRDHIGDVWYEKMFFVPVSWQDKRVSIRVGSATHSAKMWVNGKHVTEHKGGYLPFEVDVSSIVEFGKENRLTLCVNNVLDWTTLPPGQVTEFDDDMHPKGYKVQEYFHDFFNYAGIHRPVLLIATPKTYISDVTVKTDIRGNDGEISYDVVVEGGNPNIRTRLIDQNCQEVARNDGSVGKLLVKKAHLWEPCNAYLYTLVVETIDKKGNASDIYRLPVGIRTVKVTDKKFLINGKPFYFKGLAKHEDMDIKGKGLDHVINVKDFNLLKWMGANSFRTSHYPYSEEIMNLADQEGFVVIDESPAVGMREKAFQEGPNRDALLEHHIQVMRELIQRDKNHPCVVMWSVSNEPYCDGQEAALYFKKVAEETRNLDNTRPVTLVNCSGWDRCLVTQFFDVICINRYFTWYIDSGHLEITEYQLERELKNWYNRFKKPVIMTEYGADTIAGFHQDPPVMFTEEYQSEFLRHYNNVLDRLDFVIGEHVWNFADFATKQSVRRVVGNRKGVFTRQRQPKAAAHLLRKRWTEKKDF